MTKTSVLDGNSYSGNHGVLDPEDQVLAERMQKIIGPNLRLFYRRPFRPVRGKGSYLWDDEGHRYLDAYNNIPSLGHGHPAVADAVRQQMLTLSTHHRYLVSGIAEYGERLLSTMPVPMDHVMFGSSGSESNDLALRVAMRATGGTGFIVTPEAYHGTTSLIGEISPSLGPNVFHGTNVEIAQLPNPSIHTAPGDAGRFFAAEVQQAIGRLATRGITLAALIVDTIFSSDGVLDDPSILGAAVDAVHAAGGLFIADEVQPGFARTGARFWGFARHEVVPDIVTMGKPMGNGIPVSAMAATESALANFSSVVPYFSTFGGSTVPIAAAAATLNVILSEDLPHHSEQLGLKLRQMLQDVAVQHPEVGTVRQAGLFIGVEIVDGNGKPDGSLCVDILNTMREMGVLVSVAGPHNHILKIRPLLSYTDSDAAQLVEVLDAAITACLETYRGF